MCHVFVQLVQAFAKTWFIDAMQAWCPDRQPDGRNKSDMLQAIAVWQNCADSGIMTCNRLPRNLAQAFAISREERTSVLDLQDRIELALSVTVEQLQAYYH